MKRRDLLRHLAAHGCHVLREGRAHTVVVHTTSLRTTTVPRHREIEEFLAKKICRDLGVPTP